MAAIFKMAALLIGNHNSAQNNLNVFAIKVGNAIIQYYGH